ncbi:MAG: carboxy-S-adenosyl-L-methionine synthase CmoA [Candidatus Marinimicrobia bacterium]|nr:carboxy-S-adenosyl-L-methionine synthase CmoA [Candidatus Neomarinimicrobiota bacterium]
MSKDTIFSKPLISVKEFVFDESVTKVFPDMIQRSVPGYELIISTIGMFSKKYAQTGTNLYDLGCSLGAVTMAMVKDLPFEDCRIFAIDNAPAMISKLRKTIEQFECPIPVETIESDVCNIQIINASVVVLNFTLQFIDQQTRFNLIKRIYKGLNPGGILILSEKITHDDIDEEDFHVGQHLDLKRYNGYSDLEISQKRTALENFLIPESIDAHIDRLRKSGFQHPRVWFKCFNFISIFAKK